MNQDGPRKEDVVHIRVIDRDKAITVFEGKVSMRTDVTPAK